MWWILILAAGVLTVVMAIACLRVRMEVELSQSNSDTDGFVYISTLFGLVKVRKRIVSVKVTMSSDGPAVETLHTTQNRAKTSVLTTREVLHIIHHWQQWLALIRDVWQQCRSLLSKVAIHEFHVRGSVGTGDVVLTGMAYGSLWAAVSSVVGRLTYLARWKSTPDVRIDANFQQAELHMSVRCIANVRAGYLMITAMRLVRVWRRRTSDGSPNPGTHEDGHGEYSRDGRRQHDYRRSG
ncbi:DUF2953 domain-containing protein [Alicyclobacillus pomorum]|jgi:hypothetical protein|uniref:DUF2953 domain-containing protein n=1 Tax=Alicyclobacillus pomorum TaxID=204470 RepID=UPI00047E6773|nr:DUF2953 domain-containing protein [Alicyclobacillus pomorum]